MTVTFKRGIHPPEHKSATEALAITDAPRPAEVVLPLSQHTGAPCAALVDKGDEVKAGQPVGDVGAFVSAPVHASVSGVVTAVEPRPTPLGRSVECVVVEAAPDDEWVLMDPLTEAERSAPQAIKDRVRAAGIVGMGGAAFPTHVKLSPPEGLAIDTLLVNGAECEPYITADHRLMLERPGEIVSGACLLRTAIGARDLIICIEENKPDAIESMGAACAGTDARVQVLQTKYPQGGEKQLITAVLGRRVPSGGLPLHVGVVVNNAATALAVHDAVSAGRPLVERVVTVAGPAIPRPANLRARLGTPFSTLVDDCGGLAETTRKVLMGGPMMGLAQTGLDVPVVKGTSCILALEDAGEEQERPCIRCGLCVDHCPMGLVPTRLAKMVRAGDLDAAEAWGVADCMECGSCAYVCPARIPLAQLMKYGRAQVLARRRKASK